MVNEKMIEPVHADRYRMKREGVLPKSCEAIAQAVINAAWTDFDPEDESTYPSSEHSPEGHRWVVNYVADNGKFNKYFRRRKFVDPKLWKTVFEYAAAESLQKAVVE